MKKTRLDALIAARGLATSREEAKRRILAGEARVDGQLIAKAGFAVPEDADVELVGAGDRYVSRGGYKMERALQRFDVDPTGKAVLDAGASTGGFTDCLLQHGARLVYALDVGYGQLAWSLRNDPRVRVVERTNVRYATRDLFHPPIDMATADLAFIGLSLVLPVFAELLPPGGDFIALVKPQFEAGRESVEKGGVVRNPETHRRVLRAVAERGSDVALEPLEVTYSPLRGPAGNIEYLMRFVKRDAPTEASLPIDATVNEAHARL